MTELPEIVRVLIARALQLREASLALVHSVETGRLIVEDASCFSLRHLERLSGGQLKRTYLQRCVTAHHIAKSCPALLECRRLSVSHLNEVGQLARPVQCRLLIEAERQGWSVRELRESASKVRQRAPAAEVGALRRALHSLTHSLEVIAERELLDQWTLANLKEVQAELTRAQELTQQLMPQEKPRCA